MAKRPNLLVIMSDQHNPHMMGCAGDKVVATLYLDGLSGWWPRGGRFRRVRA